MSPDIREPESIDEVVSLLSLVVEHEAEIRSPLALFPALYRQMTIRVRDGIRAGFFEDGPRMERLDVRFASRYFDAYAMYRRGVRPPRAWAVAFEASLDGDALILQNLLASINAHINFDLGVAAAEIAPGEAIMALADDFRKINVLLSALLDPVQAVIDRFSPLLHLLDELGTRTDERIMEFSLERARDSAWGQAMLLAHAPEAARTWAIDCFDCSTAVLGRMILRPVGPLALTARLIKAQESKDVRAIAVALDRIPQAP